MNPPSPLDATNPDNSNDDSANKPEESTAGTPAQTDGATRETFAEITGTYKDPALDAVLEGLRASVIGGQSPVWSVINDSARLRAVYDTGLLEPGPHPEIDRVVGLTIEAIGIPNAALNMITDAEQVHAGIASRSGDVGGQRTHDLPDSLCVYTVVSGSPLIIDDIVDHPVLRNHSAALSGAVGAYIGIPIVNDAGHRVGTLCAWDDQPRHWSSGEIQIMTDLADVVQNVIFDH
ncbi:GAF domain-containing protein [Rhodococcus sp. IEGM 1379]|uniref:GAF domain-containing protein n=1 Tax=Rhodococcus sp. IEGM 1379 TaxID=3047086 RepID=UPI0024B70160|nr:GAF domain-containing protein [Rhodococcus sp. IEGM 1379]MDI9916918.1 GAF domain-containing protein [Rhodococcus sp. IEGM 1379]